MRVFLGFFVFVTARAMDTHQGVRRNGARRQFGLLTTQLPFSSIFPPPFQCSFSPRLTARLLSPLPSVSCWLRTIVLWFSVHFSVSPDGLCLHLRFFRSFTVEVLEGIRLHGFPWFLLVTSHERPGSRLLFLPLLAFQMFSHWASRQGPESISRMNRSAYNHSGVPFHTKSGLGTLPGTSLGCDRLTKRTRMAQGHFLKPWEQVPGNAAKAITGPTMMSEVAKSDTQVFTLTEKETNGQKKASCQISTRRPVVSDTSRVSSRCAAPVHGKGTHRAVG